MEMVNTQSRRSFIKSSGMAAVGASVSTGLATTASAQRRSSKLRVGVVGGRFGSNFWAFKLHPNCDVVAVSDLRPKRLARMVEVFECNKTYPSLEEMVKAKLAAQKRSKLQRSANMISKALGREIKAGSVDVELEGQKIIIRVREKASFTSGEADLKDAFLPILDRVAKILKDSDGKIIVAGHTDNVPIYTERFRSDLP